MTPRRVDEAEALYREALRVDGNNPRTTAHAHFNLALIEHLDYQPPDLDAAEARTNGSTEHRDVCFARRRIVLRGVRTTDRSCHETLCVPCATADRLLCGLRTTDRGATRVVGCQDARLAGCEPRFATERGTVAHSAAPRRGPEASYRACLELLPTYAAAQYNLGNILTGRFSLAEAEQRYRNAIANDPGELLGRFCVRCF